MTACPGRSSTFHDQMGPTFEIRVVLLINSHRAAGKYRQVGRTINSRVSADGGYDYLVHWQAYSSAHNSWERWENVWETAAYKAFHRRHKKDVNQHFPPSSAHHQPKRS